MRSNHESMKEGQSLMRAYAFDIYTVESVSVFVAEIESVLQQMRIFYDSGIFIDYRGLLIK